jgi:hypothetical protein
MGHFAKVENGIVVEVIVGEPEIIATGIHGDPANWIQTSYNTRNGIHYGPDGQPDGGKALRGNYAGIGYVYDTELDAFYEPKPFPSWLLNHTTFSWYAPKPRPTPIDENRYIVWNEDKLDWVELVWDEDNLHFIQIPFKE